MFATFVQAFVLAILGMGVVFSSLILLMWTMKSLTWLFRYELAQEPVTAAAAPAPAQDAQLDQVLAAAAAYFLEAERPALYIPPVTRRSTRWAARGRASAPLRRPR